MLYGTSISSGGVPWISSDRGGAGPTHRSHEVNACVVPRDIMSVVQRAMSVCCMLCGVNANYYRDVVNMRHVTDRCSQLRWCRGERRITTASNIATAVKQPARKYRPIA